MDLELDFVRSLVKLMSEHNLQELKLEEGEQRIHLLRGKGSTAAVAPVQAVMPAMMPTMQMPVQAAPQQQVVTASAAPAVEAVVEDDSIQTVASPMVGTFYRAPSPDSEAFVKEGDEVGDDTTLAIIEAMKVMNEIKAECSGEIVEILVANGEAVEYNQPLFKIRKSEG